MLSGNSCNLQACAVFAGCGTELIKPPWLVRSRNSKTIKAKKAKETCPKEVALRQLNAQNATSMTFPIGHTPSTYAIDELPMKPD